MKKWSFSTCVVFTVVSLSLAACKVANLRLDDSSINLLDVNQRYAAKAEKKLLWVETSNVSLDSADAIKRQDYRLWVYRGRGVVVPGVDVNKPDQSLVKLEQLCGLRYLDGVGDTVFSVKHMNLLSKVYDYAEDYNRHVVEHCLKQ